MCSQIIIKEWMLANQILCHLSKHITIWAMLAHPIKLCHVAFGLEARPVWVYLNKLGQT